MIKSSDEKKRPRVLLVVTKAGIGGAQKRIANLARTLSQEGISVLIGYGEGEGILPEVSQHSVRFFKFSHLRRSHNPWHATLFIKEMKSLCSRENFQAVHLNSSNALPGALGVKLAESNVKTIFTFRGLSLLDPGYQTNSFFKLVYKLFFKFFLNWVDVGVFQCRANKEVAHKQGFLSKRWVIIEEGIELDALRRVKRQDAGKQLGKLARVSLEGRIVLGTVARLSYAKNQDFLIKALSRIKKRHDFVFFFIGDGPLRHDLEKHVADLGLEEEVLFLGEISEASSLLKALDVFILTSRYEGLSVAVTEAIASGVSVLASDVGCMKALLPLAEARYKSGDMEDFLEKLEVLIEREDLRKKVAESLEKHSLNFDFRRSAKKYVDIYFNHTHALR